jgi:hypothetical protein
MYVMAEIVWTISVVVGILTLISFNYHQIKYHIFHPGTTILEFAFIGLAWASAARMLH